MPYLDVVFLIALTLVLIFLATFLVGIFALAFRFLFRQRRRANVNATLSGAEKTLYNANVVGVKPMEKPRTLNANSKETATTVQAGILRKDLEKGLASLLTEKTLRADNENAASREEDERRADENVGTVANNESDNTLGVDSANQESRNENSEKCAVKHTQIQLAQYECRPADDVDADQHSQPLNHSIAELLEKLAVDMLKDSAVEVLKNPAGNTLENVHAKSFPSDNIDEDENLKVFEKIETQIKQEEEACAVADTVPVPLANCNGGEDVRASNGRIVSTATPVAAIVVESSGTAQKNASVVPPENVSISC